MVQSMIMARGDIAQRAGVHRETVRYYEQIGLLAEPSRSPGGHRRYGEPHLRRLLFIRRCRELDFSLEEIANLAALCDSGEVTCRGVRDLTLRHLDAISAKIRDLQQLEQSLHRLVSRCDGALQPECPVVDALAEPADSNGFAPGRQGRAR